MKLENIIDELHFINEVEQAILKKFSLSKKRIFEIAKTAYDGENFDFTLCKCMPLTRLCVVTYLLVEKYDEYRAKGVFDHIILDTFRDISLRASLYYKKTGKVGISKDDVIWFRHIMNVSIFKIGSLQFQDFKMIYLDEETIGEPYMTFTKLQKEDLPNGTPVLNCHIQQGVDISPKVVEESFQCAKEFFVKIYNKEKYRAFLCYSWLLYPPMLKELSIDSKIKKFADNFSIISYCSDSEQAIEYLFGKKVPKVLPTNSSSLQKLAFEQKEILGFGCGIIAI